MNKLSAGCRFARNVAVSKFALPVIIVAFQTSVAATAQESGVDSAPADNPVAFTENEVARIRERLAGAMETGVLFGDAMARE